jgi:hypothetical protein
MSSPNKIDQLTHDNETVDLLDIDSSNEIYYYTYFKLIGFILIEVFMSLFFSILSCSFDND